ncbi:CapA family protein [Erythrobacter litoralis]|uniref:CapA family protein n=1 Tax=Erythrobacter litoralis TaxID=39960 RepID=UPI002435886B|nr:CapA family protein [Erythrobacter litoralis]
MHAIEDTVHITGSLDGSHDRINTATIEVAINGHRAERVGEAGYRAEVPIARYYFVEIGGPAIFPTMQTFGNGETYDAECACLKVPPIELVARKKGRIELFFGGDSMAGRRFFEADEGEQAVLDRVTLDRDLDRLFTAIRPYFAHSDLASINLESVVAAEQPGPPAPKKYLFFSPPELPMALARAGIDHVSLGNNHTADYRAAGLRTTFDALDAAGVAWSGAGMDKAEAERASRFDLGGQKIGVYGFVGWRGTWEPNQTATETKAGAAWGLASVVEDVTVRERRAGFIPIMQFHGNLEYADRPSEMSLPRYRRAIEKGSPLVVGHHPHVTHGLELYRGGLIAHSLGNFLFDQEHPHTHVTYGLKVWLEKGRFLRAEVVPIQMLDYRPVPATGGMREAVLRRLYWLSAEMGTTLHQSGGHAAVWRKGKRAADPACAPPQPFRLASLSPACVGGALEYGRNLVPRGDFENALAGYARDRFWAARGAATDFRGEVGNTHLFVLPESADRAFHLYSKSYIRDIYARRFTLETKIRVPRNATVTLLVKPRPHEGDPPSSSIAGEKLATVDVAAASEGEWQTIRLPFELPEEAPGTARAFRFILKFAFEDGQETGTRMVELDDFALVEWPEYAAQSDPTQAWRWTHARPSQATAQR